MTAPSLPAAALAAARAEAAAAPPLTEDTRAALRLLLAPVPTPRPVATPLRRAA